MIIFPVFLSIRLEDGIFYSLSFYFNTGRDYYGYRKESLGGLERLLTLSAVALCYHTQKK